MIEFGTKLDGQVYIPRAGAYAVMFDRDGRVAVMVSTHTGEGYLPGGGIETRESPEEALRREVMEECGHDVAIVTLLGEASEWFYAKVVSEYFQIHGTFFSVEIGAKVAEATETDATLVWMSPEDAVEKLVRGGQVWAVREAVRLRRS